jgi:hypothetical protein
MVRALLVLSFVTAACSGSPPAADAPPPGGDAPAADAALADAGFDARPPDHRAVVVEPLVTFPEPIPGPRFTRVFGGVAHDGSRFVVKDDATTLAVVGADRAITGQWLGGPAGPQPRRLACSPSGPCALSWTTPTSMFDVFDLHLAISGFADAGAAAPVLRSRQIDSFLDDPEVGAYAEGFVVVTIDETGTKAYRFRLDGSSVDATPIEVFTSTSLIGVACDATQCTVYGQGCTISGCELRLRRFHADGTIDPELAVPAIQTGSRLACTAGTCIVQHLNNTQVSIIAPDGTVTPQAAVPVLTLPEVVATPTGFFVVGTTQTAPTLTAIPVGFDGSVGAAMPIAPVLGTNGRPRVACDAAGCLVAPVTTSFGTAGLARFTATAALDTELAVPTVPTRQRAPRVATDGDRFFVEWSREAAGWTANTAADRRGAIWDPATGWSTTTSASTGSIPSLWTRPVARDLTWNGTRYVGVTHESNSRVAFFGATGAVVGGLVIPAQVDDVVCLDARCLATGPGGWALLRADGTIDRELELAGGEARSRPMRFVAHGEPVFAFARRDGGSVTLAVLAADGLSETILPVSAGSSVAELPIAATAVGDHIVVAWRTGSGATFARTVGPDLSIGPLTPLTITGDWSTVAAAPLGDNALIVLLDPGQQRYVGIRLDPQLAPVGDPFPISPPTVETDGVAIAAAVPPRVVSAGDRVVVAWSRLDPALGPQLALVPIRLE